MGEEILMLGNSDNEKKQILPPLDFHFSNKIYFGEKNYNATQKLKFSIKDFSR